MSQRLTLLIVWKLFPFFLWIFVTIIYYKWWITINLPFDLFTNLPF